MKLWGPVITNLWGIYKFLSYKNKAALEHMPYNAIKVITSWGMPWNDLTRAQVLATVPNAIVRTTAGDPSNKSASVYLLPDVVVEELRPWVAIKPDVMIELGNEPNIKDVDPWIYRWWLKESIIRCRREFPAAHIISPALIHNDSVTTWLDIMADVMAMADSIGIHVYEHYGFIGTFPAKTNQFALLDKAHHAKFPAKPFILTEFGINDPPTPKKVKHRRYYEFVQSLPPRYLGGLYYHINEANDIDPQYHLGVTEL